MVERKYRIGIALLVAASLISLASNTHLIDALFLFLLMGLLPGTTFVLPPWIMMVAVVLMAVAAVSWLLRQPLYIGSLAAQEKTARQLARQKAARRVSASDKKSRLRTRRRKPAAA